MLRKISDSRIEYDSTDDIYSHENKTQIATMIGTDWRVFNSNSTREQIIAEILLYNSLDVSCLYEKTGLSGNNTVITTRDFIISYDLIDTVKKILLWRAINTIIDLIPTDWLITEYNRDVYIQRNWNELLKRGVPIDEVIKMGLPYELTPEKNLPYKNLSDDQIFAAVPSIEKLSGYRTRRALTAIRRLTTVDNIQLSQLHVIYKSSGYESKTDIKIGYTNGRGGYCKEACFLSWK